MITQGVKATAPCETCGGTVTIDRAQFIESGQVWWQNDTVCGTCAVVACERDTGGATPEAIRQALLAEHGPARLRLAGAESNLVSVLRALRGALDLSMGEARAKAAELGSTGLVGTLVEMEFVAAGLRSRSVATVITTGEAPTG